MTRLYGWAPQDLRATGSVPRNHGKNTTLVAALTPDGLHVPWMLEGAMDTATFEWYIREQVGPTLRPGQVVVLDHLRVHQAERSRHALEARHCQLLFLPPYSPDAHPDRAGLLQDQGPAAWARRPHPRGALGGHAGGDRGDHTPRCDRLVRPRRLRPVCSTYLKVALSDLRLRCWHKALRSLKPMHIRSMRCLVNWLILSIHHQFCSDDTHA